MSAPPADRLVHDARIGPDDTPHEAATHLWAQVVANHDVTTGGPLARLAVLDRVVLVLHDVFGLSSPAVAQVLHAEPEAVAKALDTSRARLGLPVSDAEDCAGRDQVRTSHPAGDPTVIGALVDHTAACPTCSGRIHEDRHHRHRWWTRGGAGAAGAAGTAAAGTALGASALGGTLAAAAGIVAAGVAVGALVGPMPEPAPPDPVVVDGDPALPSDDEPVTGWPTEQDAHVTTSPDAGAANGEQGGEGGDREAADTGGSTTGEPGDRAGELTDTVEDVGDVLDETVGDVTDTVDETTDDVTDTLDDATGGATGDAVDDTVDDATDMLEPTTDGLP